MAMFWITEVVALAITALLPICLFPLTGVMPARLVAREYLNDTTFLFIGGLIVAVAVEKCHLHERLALNVLRLVGMLFFKTFLIN
jgi:sodium-dependent dicarboxylate transporter 2/3/5